MPPTDKKERAQSDVEMLSLNRIVRTLEALEPEERARVVEYLFRRYGVPRETP